MLTIWCAQQHMLIVTNLACTYVYSFAHAELECDRLLS